METKRGYGPIKQNKTKPYGGGMPINTYGGGMPIHIYGGGMPNHI